MASAFRPLRGRSRACSSGLGATPLQRSGAQNTGQRASNIGSEFRNRSNCWKQRSSSVLCDVWVDTGMRSRRVLVAADSRVSMSALAKGRSSSHTLNDIRNQLCKLCLFGNSVMGKSVRRALTLSACRVLAGGASCAAVGPVHYTSPRSRVPRSWAGVWGRRAPRFSGYASLTTFVQSRPCCADWYMGDEIGSRATSAIRDVVVSDRQTSRAGTFVLYRSCRIRTSDLQMRTWGQPAGRPCQSSGLGSTRESSV